MPPTEARSRRILHVLFSVTACLGLLAFILYLNRHRVWSPGLETDQLCLIQHENGYAYIAPTHRPDLDGSESQSLGVILENGLPLPGPAGSLHDDIRQLGKGRYSFWGESVYFASSDNSAPDTNGRTYQIQYPRMASGRLALTCYSLFLVSLGIVTWVAAIRKDTRRLVPLVLSRYIAPFFYFVCALSVALCLLMCAAYLARKGMVRIPWPPEIIRGVLPELPYGKSFLARSLEISGVFLSLGILGLAIFKLLGAELPSRLRRLALFGEELVKCLSALLPIFAIIVVACAIWFRFHPFHPPPRDLETIIVEQQIRRAKTIREADVLVIGDSSALMGVDAPLLERSLNVGRVENLATLGWVGPRGYSHLLELYFRRGLHAKAVVLLMHGMSLDRPQTQWNNWEEMVLNEDIPAISAGNLMKEIRSGLSGQFFDWAFAPPMPGAWGRFYGTQIELAGAIAKNNGSIFQPLLQMSPETNRWDEERGAKNGGAQIPTSSDLSYRLSPFAALGLREFADVVARADVPHVLFGITPTYLSTKTTRAVAENSRVAKDVEHLMHESLGKRVVLLELEPFRPDEYFASNTHMNSLGRDHFTHDLARILDPMLKSGNGLHAH